MQVMIRNGTVELSGEPILSQIDLEINTQSRIGIVGRNGCGKTTLLRLLSGELHPAKKPGADDTVFAVSGKPTVGMLSQMTFADDRVTLVDEVRSAYSEILTVKARLDELQQRMETTHDDADIREYSTLMDQFTNLGGFYFEREYEAAIAHFGFTDAEKHKPLSDFSGGQRTKIAFLKLLLSKPDLLLLDEPTNHLDIEAVRWLEDYLRGYKKAFVIVSHDRMFLDRTVEMIYEIEHGKTVRYVGNYTAFCAAKKVRAEQQAKQYAAQQKEIAHLQAVADRFRYKATKAAMAQSKLKQIDRMEKIDAPEAADLRTFHTDFAPDAVSAKEVLTVKELKIGYTSPLSTVGMAVERGDRIGIVGGNGLGKSTFLKTLVGDVSALGGTYTFGGGVKIGYFDQQMARYVNHETVFDNFLSAFPRLNDFEVRSALGAFLFTGDEVFKTLDVLSGGERVRLALCKLFQNRPNVLILDEPTNHMDILGKETLEELLLNYGGTLIFVSHDRYFVQKLATKLLVFENGTAQFYPYGYEQYENARRQPANEKPTEKAEPPKPKKTFTTPLKERSKRERALQKAEEAVALLEEKRDGIQTELQLDENLSDYLKLSELQKELAAVEEDLSVAVSVWERAAEALDEWTD